MDSSSLKENDFHGASPDPAPTERSWWSGLLCWLCGTSQTGVRGYPKSEQDRIKVLGFAILVPSFLAVASMFFYVTHQWSGVPRWSVLGWALAWGLVIMSVNRILIATYRPLEPLRGRLPQIALRVLLATFLSSAIALPFCLDLFSAAITTQHLASQQELLAPTRGAYDQRRSQIESRARERREVLETRRDELRASAYVPRELQVSQQAKTWESEILPRLLLADSALQALATEEVQLASQADQQQRRVLELEALRERYEKAAQADEDGESHEFINEFQDRTLGRGPGVRTAQLRGRAAQTQQLESEARQQLEATTAQWNSVSAERQRASAAAKSTRRQEYLAQLSQQIDTKTAADQSSLAAVEQALEELDQRYEADRADLERAFPLRAASSAGPEGKPGFLQQVVAMYHLAFSSESAATRGAVLMQCVLVFGVIFTLDLIPLIAKVMMKGGLHDAVVHVQESVARENALAMARDYPAAAAAWVSARSKGVPDPRTAGTLDLRDEASLLRMISGVHDVTLPAQQLGFPGAVTAPPDARYQRSDEELERMFADQD
ncbi:MAG: DUF4407 domain-containing protein [Pseudomonadota bacterium]